MGAFDVFNTETCVITRKTPANDGTGAKIVSTIYSGPCDYQFGNHGMYEGPGGAVDQSDAHLFIDPASDGTLPDVHINDACAATITFGGVTQTNHYTVLLSSPHAGPIPHLKLDLKRGGLTVKPKG